MCMRVRCALIALITLTVGYADTAELRNGNVVTGTYLGGNSRQIRMEVGDRIETYDVNEITVLRFTGGETARAPAAAERQPERERVKLMRPEPSTQSAPASDAN